MSQCEMSVDVAFLRPDKRYRLRRRGRHWREVRQESEKGGAELASICIESNREQKAEEEITYL